MHDFDCNELLRVRCFICSSYSKLAQSFEKIRFLTNKLEEKKMEYISNAKMSGSGRFQDLSCSFSKLPHVWNAGPSITGSAAPW